MSAVARTDPPFDREDSRALGTPDPVRTLLDGPPEEERGCRQCGEDLPDPVLKRWPDLCGVCGEEADQDEREDAHHERRIERGMVQ